MAAVRWCLRFFSLVRVATGEVDAAAALGVAEASVWLDADGGDTRDIGTSTWAGSRH